MFKKDQLLYIELKSNQSDTGPAWIGRAKLSKPGGTVYFNGKAMKILGGQGRSGNYYCLETGDEYWISGVKKNGCDRHGAGSGQITIDTKVVDEYLSFRNLKRLDPTAYREGEIKETDVEAFHDLENRSF